MGRSVSYPSNAIVAFRHYTFGEGEECGQCDGTGRTQSASTLGSEVCAVCDGDGHLPPDYYDGDDFVDDMRQWLVDEFKSLQGCDKWIGREDHALAENRFCYAGVSEYCGLVAIWLKSKADDLEGACYSDEASLAPLARHWLDQVEARFLKTFSTLAHVGTASNGEAFYRQIDTRPGQ